MDSNKMREQFEVEARKHFVSIPGARNWLTVMANGDYQFERVQLAWIFWKASREALVVELPKVVGFEGAYDSHRHHEFVPSMSDVEDAEEIFGLCRRVEAKEAIEAQGLKVAP